MYEKPFGQETKMLQKNWSKWLADKRSLCQMIEKDSVTCGCGWKVLLGVSASRIKQSQVLFSKGKLQTRVVWAVSRWVIQCKHCNCSMMLIRSCVNVFYINTNDNKIGWCPPSNKVERFMSFEGSGQVIIKNQNLHMTKQNTSWGSLTSM
jgi:hypothetical protein